MTDLQLTCDPILVYLVAIESVPGHKSIVWRSKKYFCILRLVTFLYTYDRMKI